MTYVTAGFPTADDTVDVLLGMEAGGAGKNPEFIWQLLLTDHLDVIELGLPFTDPIADGPTIQKANTVSILISFFTTTQESDNYTASSPKRHHNHLDPRDGTDCEEEGPASSHLVYGVLQPDAQIR